MLEIRGEIWVRTPAAGLLLRCSRNTVPRRAARLGVRSMSLPGTTTPVYALRDLERVRAEAEASAWGAKVKGKATSRARRDKPRVHA